MIHFYFASIFVWVIILTGTLFVTSSLMKGKGRTENGKRPSLMRRLFLLVCIAAIPVVRAIVVIGLFMVSLKEIEE